jgi:hypothetical protein
MDKAQSLCKEIEDAYSRLHSLSKTDVKIYSFLAWAQNVTCLDSSSGCTDGKVNIVVK